MKARIPGLASLVLLVAACWAPAAAGVDVDFGAAVRIDDRSDLFFSISARYFDRDKQAVERVAVRYRDPDDLAVALFVCKHSGKSPDEIHALRRKGLSWWDIGVRLDLPADLWFLPTRRPPGPPYGKAYGHWKNHKRDRRYFMVLSDDDVRNLVAVRMVHDYYGLSVETAMEMRAAGENLRWILSEEYGRRHGPAPRPGHPPSGARPGKGPGKGHDKGKKRK